MKLKGRFNILDTETTGLHPNQGHRIVEIGIVEFINGKKTGNEFHKYINPQGKSVGSSYKIHGLSNKFLSDKPIFEDIYDSFIEFIGNDPLVIHNAKFDMNFLSAEIDYISEELFHNKIYDTQKIAQNCNHGGKNNSLDSLCKAFGIKTGHRKLHGALKDAHLLTDVFVNLMRIS